MQEATSPIYGERGTKLPGGERLIYGVYKAGCSMQERIAQ